MSRTKPHKQRTQIINLLGNPNLTHAQIAETVGVSTKTVQRTSRDIKLDVEEVQKKLAEYQVLLRDCLPIPERVELVAKIAQKADSNPFAAMKALQRVDDLDGILTPKDELKRPQEAPEEHRPMFILPPSTSVQVNVRENEIPGSTEIKAIDVTPEPAEDEFKS